MPNPLVAQGKNESLRARAILRSLVPLSDLEGVLSLPFTLRDGEGEDASSSDMPAGAARVRVRVGGEGCWRANTPSQLVETWVMKTGSVEWY